MRAELTILCEHGPISRWAPAQHPQPLPQALSSVVEGASAPTLVCTALCPALTMEMGQNVLEAEVGCLPLWILSSARANFVPYITK